MRHLFFCVQIVRKEYISFVLCIVAQFRIRYNKNTFSMYNNDPDSASKFELCL